MKIFSPEDSSSETRCQKRISLLGNFIPEGGVGAELGVFRGSFVEYLLQLNPSRLYLIDPWYLAGNNWCKSWVKGEKSGYKAFIKILDTYADEIESMKVLPIPGTSQTFLSTLENECLDWVYLDSIHSFVQVDFEISQCLTRMKKGGIISGDDYYVNQKDHKFYGVVEAVHKHVELGHIELLCDGEKNQFVAKLL